MAKTATKPAAKSAAQPLYIDLDLVHRHSRDPANGALNGRGPLC